MPPARLTSLVSSITCICLDLRSVWSIDHEPQDGWESRGRAWRLLAFGDPAALRQLRSADNLRDPSVELLVVLDGDVFATAWGPAGLSGSLARWGWRSTSAGEAYYDESRWEGGREAGVVMRSRRKALLVWQAEEPALT